MTRTSGDSGWVALPRPRSWSSSFLLVPSLLPLLGTASFNLAFTFVRDLPVGWVIVVMSTVVVAVLAVILLIIRLVYPRPTLSPATSTLRAGRREVPYSEISSAELLVGGGFNLLLRAGNGLRALVLIRDRRQHTLDPEASALVQEMLQQSNIAIPTSSDDPSGKFARYNFPNHLTKEGAIELVVHPPALGDQHPIPPRT